MNTWKTQLEKENQLLPTTESMYHIQSVLHLTKQLAQKQMIYVVLYSL